MNTHANQIEQEPSAVVVETLLSQVKTGELHWESLAECRDADPSLFYPEKGVSNKTAKAICAQCIVREDCFEYAIVHEDFGIWGGTTAKARQRIRKQRLLAATVCETAVTLEV